MLIYILKRILYFIPTFFIISFLTFLLSTIAPGDPVELKLSAGLRGSEGQGQAADKLAGEAAYKELNEKLGRNLPTFYFSISSSAYPDTLYKILKKNDRENLARLIDKYGKWENVDAYYKAVKELEFAVITLPVDTADSTFFDRARNIRESCNNLYRNYEDAAIQVSFKNIRRSIDGSAVLSGVSQTKKVFAAYEKLQKDVSASSKLIPSVHWYGTKNQYHRWLFGEVPWFGKNDDPTKSALGFFRGDFGDSYLDNRPVRSILFDALKWTLLMNIIIFIIIYSVGIPSGVFLARFKGTAFDRIFTTVLFINYSIPSFWIGTMLIIFFTSGYYAHWMDLFPPYGLGKIGDEFGTWEKITDRAYHLILPIFCSVYGSFAYISRQMRGGMLSILRQDYIRTAFAKGLNNRSVYWRHAFRNSLIPIITLFSSFLPAMISGSVIIEYLFTIPGMGRVSYESVVARNFPVLFTILMFSAVLTMLGTLLADVLYAISDPRISFTKKEG